MHTKDETGNRYGRLTVLRRDGSTDMGAMWLCLCDCGGQRRVAGKSLRQRSTRSCGCLQRERTHAANSRPKKPRIVRAKDTGEVLTIPKKREPWVGGFDHSGYLCGEPPSWLLIGAVA